MSKEIPLSDENIVDVLDEFKKAMEKGRIEPNRVNCSSILLEEIMFIYAESLGESAKMNYSIKIIKSKLIFTLSFLGKELNPQDCKNALVYMQVLKQAPDVPEWEYRNGKNIVVLALPLFNTLTQDVIFAWKYTKNKKNQFFLGVLSQFIATALNIVGTYLVARLIVEYTNNLFIQSLGTAAAIFIFNIIEQLVTYAGIACYNRVSYSILSNVQKDMVSSVLSIKSETMTSNGNGVFTQRMTGDTATFAAGLNTVMDLLIQIGSYVGILVAIGIVSIHFFVIEIFILILLFIIQKFSGRYLIDFDRDARKAGEKYSGFIAELVSGFNDIRTLHCEESIQNELCDRVVESSEKHYKLTLKRQSFKMITALVSNLGTLAVMGILAGFIGTGILDAAMAIVVYNYHSRLGPGVIATIDSFSTFYTKFRLSCERINSLIFGSQFPKEHFGTIHKDVLDGKIEVKNVSFSYRRRQNEFFVYKTVLNKLTLTVEPKQTAAFVGASGCGKSTLFKLLNKQYSPILGNIYLDGINIEDLDKDTIRNSICIINQNPYIFHCSVRQNLQFVNPDLTEEAMIRACKAACIHDDIMEMEEGYDTVLGEGGIDISGGQKQRLAIARGLLCDATIFVLDEATSALDNKTQARVMEAIKNIGKDHTVLVIAHRLSTIVDSDVIFYIGDGHVVGQGTHAELMENCEEYRQLYLAEDSAKK